MKLYKKIDIYQRVNGSKNWVYICSTNWSKTCKEAKAKFCEKNKIDPALVDAGFSRG